MTERMYGGFVLVDETKDESLTNKPTNSKMSKSKANAAVGETPSAGYQIPLDLKSLSKSIKDTTPLVSWYLDDGKTEIQIAKVADIKDAKFDVLIIPVDTYMQSVNVLDGDLVRRNYGSWFPNVKPPVNPGQVYYSYQHLKKFTWKCIFAGVCVTAGQYNRHVATIVSNVLTHKTIKNDGIFGIPLNFTGFYDPLVFVEKLLEQKFRLSLKSLSVVLYCKGDEPSLPPFIKSVDEFMCKQRSPRRLLHSKILQDELRIETKIIERGILNAGCECVVAAIGFDLKLDLGQILQSISEEAGSELQECINKLARQKPPKEAIIYCPPFKLAEKGIKSILFGRLPKHEFEDKKKLRQILSSFVKECLLMADDLECSSIAFPALGSGYLKYPDDVIGLSINDGIDKYAASGIKGFVKRVCISYFGRKDSVLYQKLESGIARRASRFHSQQNQVADDIPSADDEQQNKSLAVKQKGDQGTPDLPDWQKGADGTDNLSNKGHSSSEKDTLKTNYGNNLDNKSISPDNTLETSNDEELLLDDVTADVNPGLAKYLLDSGQYGKFRDHFTKQFGIRVEIDKQAILFRGSLDNIMKVEKELDKMVENASYFNGVMKPENASAPTSVTHATGNSSNQASRNKETDGKNQNTDYVPFDDNQITPLGTSVRSHDLQNESCVNIFKTDNMFSFSTDVKVLTTDKDQTHETENHFMRQAKDKIPKLKGIVVEESFEIISLVKLCTCKFIVIAVVPNDSKDIKKREKDKSKFKGSISNLTNGILQKADLLDVRSITLPLLVNAEKEAHISTCCNVMAEEILAFLQSSTNIRHVNVILESGSVVKGFSKCVEQKLLKTSKLSTQF